MPKYDQYHSNYKKLYPGIEDKPEFLAVLKNRDRKMEYIEVDLKSERFIQDQGTGTAVFLPSREDSYDRLCDEEQAQFAVDEDTPEEKAIRADDIRRLRAALLELAPDEMELIHALFYKEVSEHRLAKQTGIPQRTIHYRKVRILAKLHKLLEN